MLFFVNFCLAITLLFSFCFLLLSLISPRLSMFWTKKQFDKKNAAIFYLKVFAPVLIIYIIFINIFGDSIQKNADKDRVEMAIKERKADSLKHINDSLKVIEDSLKVIEDNKKFVASSIDIGDFLDKYNGNRVAADKAFKGKELIIYGFIGYIEKIDNGQAYIALRPRLDRVGYDRVICYLSPEDVLNFNTNDEIYVKGKFKGVDDRFTVPSLKMVVEQIVPVKK